MNENNNVRQEAIRAVCGGKEPVGATAIQMVNVLTEFGEQLLNRWGGKLERENAFLVGVITAMANEFMEAEENGRVVFPDDPHLERNVNLALGV